MMQTLNELSWKVAWVGKYREYSPECAIFKIEPEAREYAKLQQQLAGDKADNHQMVEIVDDAGRKLYVYFSDRKVAISLGYRKN